MKKNLKKNLKKKIEKKKLKKKIEKKFEKKFEKKIYNFSKVTFCNPALSQLVRILAFRVLMHRARGCVLTNNLFTFVQKQIVFCFTPKTPQHAPEVIRIHLRGVETISEL